VTKLPDVLAAVNYIPHSLQQQWMTYNDPMDIPTPLMDSIIDVQQWTPAVKRVFYAIIFGRSLFPVGRYDNFGFAPMLCGVEQSGKTTILRLLAKVHGEKDVYTLSDDSGGQFSLANAVNAFLAIIFDVGETLSVMSPDAFRTIVTPERITISRMHAGSLEVDLWSTPLILCGHHGVPSNVAGRYLPTILPFKFTNKVPEAAVDFDIKLQAELPALIAKGVRAYYQLAQQTRGRSIWETGMLPEYFHQ
jgi:hypothetical protein